MSKPIPTVQKYMTSFPHTVDADRTIAQADGIMREHQIRHLPVMKSGDLVGMLTSRDVALISSLRDVDPTKVPVDAAMSTEVYAVSPDSPLDEVAKEMASKKYGSAVVMQNGRVVGIVTTVDLCNALAELLHTRLAR
jgi:acetoin utilization protein AcuB